ncbi:uncharacterized protein L969DRAFT_19270 [Mixia osmundae IAM 14324]|uniref:Glucose-6-phosphate 1-epimerase n=1 Tax=Mixia osmundae (strain CBS 9802 / IAM 14324 / JCM 22182 / KY 12970) TaxID=764103 RepID=G7E523_MIXOS|nr:uncharacterized protein L969DRAFT_19270 [Mixia osmundae IAM 14324]KEI37795.1 hypothetical protein L969DRAFT_19270 [Mixia osmundae IAM 14324]GAA97933.1 hypothetical protein E5Q_04613 [Mixia osmundae IAM 14324]
MTISEHQGDIRLSSERHNASVTVNTFGASLHSWKTSVDANDGTEHLFVSSKSKPGGPKPIRGGVPVVWPCFGPPDPAEEQFSRLKQHGFARNSVWKHLASVSEGSSDELAFELTSTDEIRAIYALPFRLVYVVRIISPASISTSLTVQHLESGSEDMNFQALLHSYWSVDNIQETSINGLHNLDYSDKTRDQAHFTEAREVVAAEGETDRVYFDAPSSSVELRTGKGKLAFTFDKLQDVVVWNPAAKVSDGMADMEPNGWQRFICVEPGCIASKVMLKPGESWTGSQTITYTAT